ncbi:uncharacterized protein LOC111694335 [Trichogramma pretiosum]|uniref:uncharacterized protein LOC111694335 n=1 Tax=Trichogramma pretiosum TaxID=7493 RepID=UPI000C71BC40|nr:uncharacterized protein LOC111694335 [Trichogramma pretiosum]
MDFKYEYEVQKNKREACTQLKEAIKVVIQKHYRCIQLFETLNSVVRPVMLVAVVASCLNLAISGAWAIILMQINKAEALKMFFGYWMAAISLIVTCIPSQFLSNASDDLLVKIYSIKWRNYPPKVRSMIVLLMTRGQKPFELTGGPTIVLNFETCSKILKSTLSMIATFRSIYD